MARTTSAAVKRSRLNWPAGWEVEAERLAKLYERTVEGITEVEGDFARWQHTAAKLKSASTALAVSASNLRQLAEDKGHAPLMHAYRAFQTREAEASSSALDQNAFAAYVAQLASVEVLTGRAALEKYLNHLEALLQAVRPK